MNEAAGWQFDVEVRPADWRFPAGASWLAGWIFAGKDRFVTDLRVWIDDRPFLGLPGLPKPGMDEKFLGRAGPPYSGFVLQVTPHRGAGQLRLEARDSAGLWTELLRTAITVAPDAPECPPARPLASRLVELVPALLRLHAAHPGRPFAGLADEVVSAAIAAPLNSLPNPPFHGALEEPTATGRLRYGRLAVTGWLAHRTARIRRLTAIADAVQESTLLHGLARNDVGSVFGNLPQQAQFVGQVDLPDGLGGPALLKIFAELDNGEKHLAFAQRFTPQILAGAESPLPPYSRLTLARTLWALRGAARRHGLVTGPAGQFFSAARAAGATYEAEAPGPAQRTSAAVPPQPVKSAPLRILVATHNLNFEGAPRLVLELARYLARTPGSRVRVISPQEGPLRRAFEEAGMSVGIVDVAPALAAATPEAFHAALAATVRPDWDQVDLVVANTMVSFWAVHAARSAGKPAVLYVHESAPVCRFFGDILSPALFPVVEAAFRDATRVVFTAGASRAMFDRLGDGGNFRVLPSWLDRAAIDRFVEAQDRAALRAKHGLDPAAVVLLNLGTVCERKGQHNFIRAAQLLAPELRAAPAGRPVEFVMVGAREDGFLALLRQQVADAGLANVRFVPETRENLDWLRLADLLVCTSFEESSPRVLLEAALFGLPIVTTNVNGIPEIVTADEAWLVRPGDPHQLAGAIRAALAAHRAGDTRRAARARETVAARFDEAVSLPQHLALANEAAARLP